ncbi:hypothetical protein HMPREF9225_1666 [Peptoniphilus duerdenii ATCC BAA-1640]|uniref:Uncharacterized protein n=1 Tax=Peptoniphilus duerdenii ATCC BAA-1640 TaxID=862517 RepID=E0NNC7_9FIRM|nr:hypothetical protein [Peptoniphilus duerdenii]EFM24800.1 hypothetical protein HMPREF9225_1666 [Peptoniphilus duerdenii ATCC BAA-1640]
MRIDELVKRLEKIEKKHNLHFKVRKYIFETEIFMVADEDLKDLMIARIYERKANALETMYVNFLSLEDDIRAELLDIFVEYAKTPPDEREEEKRFIVPLPGLVTTDGEQQYLTHKEEHFFACRRNKDLRQTWKEKHLKYIPEEYRKYAVELSSVE